MPTLRRNLSIAIPSGFAVALAIGAGVNKMIHLSSGSPAAEAVGLLSVGVGDQRQAGFDSRATPNRTAESLVNAGAASAKTGSPDRLLSAIEFVESRRNPRAVGDGGRAVGVLQIHAGVVADCNAASGYERFTLADRTDPEKSREMFRIYIERWCPDGTDEDKARSWNGGGPRGRFKKATESYWLKVKAAMESMK